MDRLVLTSELKHLKLVRRWVERACRGAGLEHEQETDMLLVVGEAFANCVKHGYQGDPGGRVELTAAVEESHLVIRVRDRGKSSPLREASDPDLTEAHENGYGLYLMREMTDRFEVETEEPPGTTVLLMKEIRPARPGPTAGGASPGESTPAAGDGRRTTGLEEEES